MTVYDTLRRMAHNQLRNEKPGMTLQTTDLVHEAYLRLCKPGDASWENRRHFFGAAARAMRQILVDRARRLKAAVHGGGLRRATLDEGVPTPAADVDLVVLDDLLIKLADAYPRSAEVVNHRYFLGLSVDETATLLGVSPRTVDADWTLAKAWLRRAFDEGPGARA